MWICSQELADSFQPQLGLLEGLRCLCLLLIDIIVGGGRSDGYVMEQTALISTLQVRLVKLL